MFEWLGQWIKDPNLSLPDHGGSWSLSPLLYVVGDGLVILACLTVILALWPIIRKRGHPQYRGLLILLAGFVAACSSSRIIQIWGFGTDAVQPVGWLSVFAGFIAAASAFLLWPRLKIAFAQSSFDDVGDADSGLSHHARLRQLNCELEQRVEERTQALEASNRELAQQVIMREYVQQELRSSNENLNRYIEKLERQNEDITWLNVLSDQLHCCDTHGDLARVLEQHCQDYFDTDGGALFEWHGEQLKLKSSWGCWVDSDRTFSSQAVLALRLGRLFPDSAEEQSLVPTARNSDFYVLMAGLQSRDNGIGALVLLRKEPFWTGTTVLDERSDQLLRALADHTALALSNLMLRERLREQSLSDPLTGLYNRRYLYQQLARLIALWERGGESFAVILIDVDHFKSFNDRFGHEVGDEVLVAIADVLQSEVRKSDIACRMGGEEFVILMAGAGVELARERAESLRVAVKMLRLDGAQEEVVTISAGVALYPEHGADAYSLVRAADKALYESKRAGRDCISLALSECD